MPKEAPMSFTTWVRAQDAYGQFDVRKQDDLREGVTLVDGYPEHIAMTARPGKAKVDLRIEASEGYSNWRKAEVVAEINRRNAESVAAGNGPVLQITKGDTVADLKGLLELHDEQLEEAAAAAAELTSDAETPGTGEDTSTNETGAPGQESE